MARKKKQEPTTKIELTEKQAEYVQNADSRWNFSIGAVRSGKSHLGIQYIIPKGLIERKGKKGINLILGVSKETIERNVLTPMRFMWGADLVGSINSRNIAVLFGEKVYCIGAKNAGQVSILRGAEVKFCYCDEVADINKEVFEMLKSRLSLEYSQCHACANPSYPSHFIKKFIDSEGLDIYCQTYTLYDNPFLPADYISALEKEYAGTVYYQRYVLGKWAKAEGLVYPMYEKIWGVPEAGPVQDRSVSIDYGTMNAFAAMLWHKVNGIWYGVDGYYYSGRDTGRQKTDYEYSEDLEVFLADEIQRLQEGKKIRVIIDPSAASFIALLQKKRWAKVMKAKNNVLDGIRETATAIQLGLIKVNPAIKEFKDEIEGYTWDEKSQEEKPVKEADHCLTGDTLVDTENGQVRIDELVGKAGLVWSWNGKEKVLNKFHDVRKTRSNAEITKITLEDGRELKCTEDHLILTDKGWKKAGLLCGCDSILDIGLEKYVKIKKIEKCGKADVYNMEVENVHNFSVNNGLIVHNCMDSMRYHCATLNVAKQKSTYKPILEKEVRLW